MPSQLTTTLLAIFSPLVVLIVYGRIKRKRNLAELRRQAEAAENEPPKPLTFKDPPAPNAFTARFPLPERTWLREQFSLAKGGAIIVAWVTAVVLIVPMLPPFVHSLNKGSAIEAKLWFATQDVLATGTVNAAFFAAFAAMLVHVGTSTGATTIFNATRPLPRRTLFLTRAVTALAALELALAAASLLSFLVVLALWGPFWNHLHIVYLGDGYLGIRGVHRTFLMKLLCFFLWPAGVFAVFCTSSGAGNKQARKKRMGPTVAIFGGIMSWQLLMHHVRFWPTLFSVFTPHNVFSTLTTLIATAVCLLWLAPFLYARREL